MAETDRFGELIVGDEEYLNPDVAAHLRLTAEQPEEVPELFTDDTETEIEPEAARPARSRRHLIMLGGIGVATFALGARIAYPNKAA